MLFMTSPYIFNNYLWSSRQQCLGYFLVAARSTSCHHSTSFRCAITEGLKIICLFGEVLFSSRSACYNNINLIKEKFIWITMINSWLPSGTLTASVNCFRGVEISMKSSTTRFTTALWIRSLSSCNFWDSFLKKKRNTTLNTK